MIDEKRVLQVAKELSMNPDKARKLLEDARSEPAIMKRTHRYEQLVGGDRGGQDGAGCSAGGLVRGFSVGGSSGTGSTSRRLPSFRKASG